MTFYGKYLSILCYLCQVAANFIRFYNCFTSAGKDKKWYTFK